MSAIAWWVYALAAIAATSLGLLFVLLVALRRVGALHACEPPGRMADPHFVHTLEGLTNSPRRSLDALKLSTDVPAIYAALLGASGSATTTITFETYLFWSGQVADPSSRPSASAPAPACR